MEKVMARRILITSVGLIAVLSTTIMAQQLPANFTIQNAAPRNGLSEPVGLAFFPDGRLLVGAKKGKVFVIENGAMSSTPFIDLTSEVLSNEANGLMDVAIDPNYPSSPWVYLLYVVDPTGGLDDDLYAFSRLTRYKVSSSNSNLADLSSRQVLIGQTWGSGWPACSGQHVVGTLRFAKDGTLLAGSGESSQRPSADAGGRDPDCAQHYPPDHDIGAYRAQHLGSLSGKIIRIDRNTGNGLPSNPYYTGSAADNQSKVWAYGLRNPFRFAIRPNGSANPADGRPGTLYIGDVGWGDYEEVDISTGGENFGWPCYEGPDEQSNYRRTQPPHHKCSSIGTPENPAQHTPPTLYWHHREGQRSNPSGLLGACVMAGIFYTGTKYPAQYRHAFFVHDYESDWMKIVKVDADDNVTDMIDFATGIAGMADMEADPITGDLYYADVDLHFVKKIVYNGPAENAPPVAAASATPTSGSAPLAVQFSSDGSFDPEGSVITYSWNFGDGGTSTLANLQHTYSSQGNYTATLTVRDPQGLTGTDSETITVSNSGDTTPPSISAVSANNITDNGATIKWTTNEPADSRVDYGLTTSYGSSTPLDPTLVTNHSVVLSNLSASATYHYRVRSKDAASNSAVSGDFTFTTTASTFTITGTIKNASNNQPLSGARVGLQAKGNPVITDANGRFTLPNVPGVGSTITAAAERFYTGLATVSQPSEDVTIALDPIAFETNHNYELTDPTVCSRCHEQQLNRWSGSPMNEGGMNRWVHDLYSGTGTPGGMAGFVYTRDSVHRTARPNAECASCHNPTDWVKNPHNVNMGDINNPTDGMQKGVQCEICHRIFEKDENKINYPGVYPGAVTMVLPTNLTTPLQFGALGDAFVGGSQEMRAAYNTHLRSNVCATCHEDNNDHDDDGDYEEPGSVSVEPTYEEWKNSPYAVQGPNYKDCVDCHMPPYGFDYFCSEAQIARDPNTIRSHDIRGTTASFLDNAVTMTTSTEILTGDKLRVRVRINNDQTGHHVPTGVGIRNMILLVEAKSSSSGAPLRYVGAQTVHDLGGVGNPQQGYYAGQPGKIFAKSHSDGVADGVFYTEATTISWDTRIPAQQTDETLYDFELPAEGGSVQVTSKLIYRRAFRYLVDQKSWTMTGHGSALEDIQAPHYGHLTESNTMTVNVSGGAGYALRYDGSSDYVQISDNALLSGGPGKSITVEAWVKPDQVNGTRPIFEKFLDGSSKDWGLQIVEGVAEAVIESNNDNWNLQVGSISAGSWTHVAFAFDNAANLVRVFINGLEAGQKSLTKDMPDTPAALRIGIHGYASQYFVGEVDEARLWNYARSASQVAADMSRELTGAEPGLIGYWSFNEGSGQTVADRTVNANNWRLGSSVNSDASDPAWVISTAPIGSGSSTPSISSFTPASGPIGTQVTINGNNFIGASSVKFNGTAAAVFNVVSAAQITANVPSGATTGKISVTTAGGTATSANDFTVTSSSGGSTVSFLPLHDAYVKSSAATTNYGSAMTLRQRKSSSETINAYLKFEVTGLGGAVQSAKLRMYVTDASNDGGAVYAVSNNYLNTTTPWTQGGISWNNAPAISGAVLSAAGAVSLNAWIELDVTSAVTGNGTFSFGLKSNSSDVVYYGSKEGSNKPALVIQTGSTSPIAPSISSFSPASGPVGTEVAITGSNFTGASSVKFNGTAATVFSVASATQIMANVPTGATTGKISVTTAGGTATSANDFTVTSGGSTTLTFFPADDAYVKSSAATTNYGSFSTLRGRQSSTESINSFLKFSVSGLSAPVQSAKLRLYVTDASSDGGAVYSVSNNYQGTNTPWLQGGINWNNAPVISGAALGNAGAVSVGNWVEFNVTAAISGNGAFSFGLKSNSSDVVYYSSREGANKPELVIQTASGSSSTQTNLQTSAEANAVPEEFVLYQNYPNPFNPETQIRFDLPEASMARLTIYDVLGREVLALVNEERPAGRHSELWNGSRNDGQRVSSGIYFYRLQAGNFSAVRKMLLLQ
jgi:glucose/arabinose dehydrogenase